MVRLVEVSEIFPVVLKFRPHGRYEYERVFYLPKDYPRPVDGWELERFVEELNGKFPDRGYRLEDVKVGAFEFWRIRKAKRDRFYVPIYIHKLNGRVFVPQSFLKMRRARVARVLVATLGGLGYALPYKD